MAPSVIGTAGWVCLPWRGAEALLAALRHSTAG